MQCRYTIMTIYYIEAETNGRHFADDIFKCIFLNENVWIPIKISLKFVPKGPINNIPAMVQMMAWRRPSDKPLSEPMVVSLPTHICVARPQWVIWLLSRDDQAGETEYHYSDVIMSVMVTQITVVLLFAQSFVKAQIKENIKAPRHWPLCGKSTGDRSIPLTKGQ